MFLAIRMVIYILAVPVAAWLGGTFDPATGNLCLNVNAALSLASGGAVALATFASSRWAKARGLKT